MKEAWKAWSRAGAVCLGVLAAACALAQDASPSVMDEIALAQILGTTRASYDICHVEKTDLHQTALDVMATARYIADARYRQLGRADGAAKVAEQQAYDVYIKAHQVDASMPDCQIYRRQVDALAWDAAQVGEAYIRDNEAKPHH